MKFVCTKCGYSGEVDTPHLNPKGAGQLCHYSCIPIILCANAECGHDLSQHVKSGPSAGRCMASDRLGFSICRCNQFEDDKT